MQSGTELGIHVAIIMDGNGRWEKSRGLPCQRQRRDGGLPTVAGSPVNAV